MYIKFEKREEGKRFTFFKNERIINGEKVSCTDRSVFANLSESVKVGERNGSPIWENDYWKASFCGKAYEEALLLKDKDRISVVEMNIRNVYSEKTKKSYPQIMITDFDVISTATDNTVDEGYMDISADEEGLPFN